MPVMKWRTSPHASDDGEIPAFGLHFPSSLDMGLLAHRCSAAY